MTPHAIMFWVWSVIASFWLGALWEPFDPIDWQVWVVILFWPVTVPSFVAYAYVIELIQRLRGPRPHKET
jgi:hypothetical protein